MKKSSLQEIGYDPKMLTPAEKEANKANADRVGRNDRHDRRKKRREELQKLLKDLDKKHNTGITVKELKIVEPDTKDTKGIKRSEMPQVATKDYPEFIDYLKANGADFTKQVMPANQLKATQGEFSKDGVERQLAKMQAGKPKKPVIASQDNYIIDGHHRWLVAMNTRDSVEVFKIDIDADELLDLVRKFPKVTYKDIYTEELYDFNKDEPNKSIVAVPGYGTMSIDGLTKNVIDQATQLVKQMSQGTQGIRNADYALNKNKVLAAKVGALVQALDDLQVIRKKGGSNSRNIENESIMLEDGWFDYYKRFANLSDPVKPYIQNTFTDANGNPLDPNNKDHLKAIADQNKSAMKQVSQNVGQYIDTPGWQVKMFAPQDTLDRYGITREELPRVLALRDKFKSEHPEAFELIKTGQADKAWELMRNESIKEDEEGQPPQQQELPIDVARIYSRIQQFESQQFIQPQDADLMRRGVQSLTSRRQTVNPQAILQLLTMVS